MSQQVAMLVHRAALGRRLRPERSDRVFQARTAVDEQEFRGLQAARDQRMDQTLRTIHFFAPLRALNHVTNPARSSWQRQGWTIGDHGAARHRRSL